MKERIIMAKKPLGTDSMGIQKTMRVGDYLGDCGGQFALNAMTGLVSAVLYFYTEKVGVAAATAANVLLAAKIVDAFTDLIMGKIMDNGKSPKGKCRPWFLRMAIPAFVAIVALFTVPAGLTGFAMMALCAAGLVLFVKFYKKNRLPFTMPHQKLRNGTAVSSVMLLLSIAVYAIITILNSFPSITNSLFA